MNNRSISQPNDTLPLDLQGSWYRQTADRSLEIIRQEIRLHADLSVVHRTVISEKIFDANNETLMKLVSNGDPALFVLTPTVYALYGAQLQEYLNCMDVAHLHKTFVLPCSEATKTMDSVLDVCSQAALIPLARRSQIIAVGGGVCTDICGLAAALYRRGISHIKIPTTLLGQVDAGLGTKNGVNLKGKKNAIGTFHPPEFTVIDPSFLTTLSRRHFRSGLAEVSKLAVSCDPNLFAFLETHHSALLPTSVNPDLSAVSDMIANAAEIVLSLLQRDIFEVKSYQRVLDFGHTFSPYLEYISAYQITHGEAVAVDMAFSTLLAKHLNLVDDTDCDRILQLLDRLELFPDAIEFCPKALWGSLADVTAHRNGKLNLVAPTGIGRFTFIESIDDVTLSSLEAVVKQWNRMRATD